MLTAADLPTYEQFMKPVLEYCLSQVSPVLAKDINQVLINASGYSPDVLEQEIPGGTITSRLKNRIYWAVFYLRKAECLSGIARGVYQINERGKQLLLSNEPLSTRTLRQFPEFVAFYDRDAAIKNGSIVSDANATVRETLSTDISPDEELKAAYQTIKNALLAELLEILKTIDPKPFEQLVLNVLVAMGYGDGKKQWAKVTRYVGDGGIDGFIKEDPLGLDMIYVQAKRYRDKAVGEPELRDFKGSLADHAPCKGVFITTSKFVRKAQEYAERHSICLIDGEQLAEHMMDYGVGVQPKETLTLYRIDSEYFEVCKSFNQALGLLLRHRSLQ